MAFTAPDIQVFPLAESGLMHRIRLGMVEFRDRTTFSYNQGPATPQMGGSTVHAVRSIFLPMPDNIQVAYGPSWDFVDLDMGGFVLHGGFSADNVSQGFGAAMDKAKQGDWKGAGEAIPGAVQLSKILLNETARGLGADETADAVLLGLKTAFNPFKEAIFRGVANRTFAFSWNLFPRNEAECQALLTILKTLRYHSAPALSKDTVLFDYPGEFTVNFMSNGKDNEFLPRVGFCVCNGLETNFTTNGVFAALRNGHPVDIALSIALTETEIVTKDKVEANY